VPAHCGVLVSFLAMPFHSWPFHSWPFHSWPFVGPRMDAMVRCAVVHVGHLLDHVWVGPTVRCSTDTRRRHLSSQRRAGTLLYGAGTLLYCTGTVPPHHLVTTLPVLPYDLIGYYFLTINRLVLQD
jgi:hypothetical protein